MIILIYTFYKTALERQYLGSVGGLTRGFLQSYYDRIIVPISALADGTLLFGNHLEQIVIGMPEISTFLDPFHIRI